MVDPIYFIALPLLTAFLLPLFGKIHKELIRIIPGLLFAFLAVNAVLLMKQTSFEHPVITQIAGWAPPLGINLVFSPFTGFIATIINILAFLVWAYSYKFKKVEFDNAIKYFVLLMLVTAGATGVVITGDIFNQFVFLEITALSSYALTAFYRGRDGAEAAFKYLIMGSFSSVFILLAISLLYGQLGTLNMAEIAARSNEIPSHLKIIIFILFFVGFGIEAEMFPVNGWVPDAYSQAPGPIGSVFAGMTSKAGIYALIRMIYTLFDVEGSFKALVIMGAITMVVAEVIALRQERIKRMLAYSSIGQIGLIMIAFGLNSKLGVIAGLFILFNHAVIKSLLFLSASFLAYNSKVKLIKDIEGMGKQMPLTAFLFALGAFAIVGLPPLSGFWSKFYLLYATADGNMLFLLALILSVSIIEIVYYFRVIHKLYFKPYTGEYEVHKPRWNAMVSLVVLGLVIVAVGIYPELIFGFIKNAADSILDKTNYIHTVLPNLVLN